MIYFTLFMLMEMKCWEPLDEDGALSPLNDF